MEDNKIVEIKQDIYYPHNKQNEPVFCIPFKRSSSNCHVISHSIEYTVPELVAIKEEITRFLEEYNANNKV